MSGVAERPVAPILDSGPRTRRSTPCAHYRALHCAQGPREHSTRSADLSVGVSRSRPRARRSTARRLLSPCDSGSWACPGARSYRVKRTCAEAEGSLGSVDDKAEEIPKCEQQVCRVAVTAVMPAWLIWGLISWRRTLTPSARVRSAPRRCSSDPGPRCALAAGHTLSIERCGITASR